MCFRLLRGSFKFPILARSVFQGAMFGSIAIFSFERALLCGCSMISKGIILQVLACARVTLSAVVHSYITPSCASLLQSNIRIDPFHPYKWRLNIPPTLSDQTHQQCASGIFYPLLCSNLLCGGFKFEIETFISTYIFIGCFCYVDSAQVWYICFDSGPTHQN